MAYATLNGNEEFVVSGVQTSGQPSSNLIHTNVQLVSQWANVGGATFSTVATADNGTTQTLTAAMVTGGNFVAHVTTGGSTPSLTMPLATALIAAIPQFAIGQSYILRIINSNSGTATIVTNTGITTTGTLTVATGTTRDFLITYTAAATLTMVSIGTGTNS